MAVCSEIHTKQINTVCGLNVELLNVKPAVSNVCYHSLQNLLSSSLLLENIKIKKFITIILHVILYGCETWSLTLREERRLRVFENGMLRRIFGPKRDEVTREWRRLHNGDLNDLYYSPNIVRVVKSRRMRWAVKSRRMR